MPRRKPKSPQRRVPPVYGEASMRRVEADADGASYIVRTVPSARAVKTYRCPGCDHEIRPGVAHVVAWESGADGEDRRHWHSGCWSGRQTRGITRRWS
ncbi:hypothetical protein FOS14_23215 [Skermania sp. ID1734]|uniref:hypothetical protein n=1 Tax=Skermania sp. ID1734 TaxID=2597516 RepID=UPI00118144F7|nr:hypothetical protein [Skermania sp. ID1734]TSD93333.1 hypothetical protein FOS14_23215 [Skermania sp. ID1734]